MGLDNSPEPYVAEVLGTAKYELYDWRDKLKYLWYKIILRRKVIPKLLVDCKRSNCPFMEVFKAERFACLFSGGAVNYLVLYATGGKYSLYCMMLPPEALEEILECLKKLEIDKMTDEEIEKEIGEEADFVRWDYNFLVKYLETLLSIKEWVEWPGAHLSGWW